MTGNLVVSGQKSLNSQVLQNLRDRKIYAGHRFSFGCRANACSRMSALVGSTISLRLT